MSKAVLKITSMIVLLFAYSHGVSQKVEDYVQVIKTQGENPLKFAQRKLDTYDLLIFDDALHNALEPFEYYEKLLGMDENKIEYVFIEVFGINQQRHIDAYLQSAEKDKSLLLKVFQDDFSGHGWRYETYLDLLSTVWDLNHSKSKKIKVKAVDQPIYWEGIHTREDYDAFLKSLVARDYFMYKTIIDYMGEFAEGKKGIFLTNTRHAYKQVRDKRGKLYWNCGTFFKQWYPNKTYSLRIHNATLSIMKKAKSNANATSDGLAKYTYEWVKMENGIWDEALSLNGNIPVAFSLQDNVFGQAGYIGNHMLNVEAGLAMYDAYDALVFLKPLDELHFSGKVDFIYTNSFKTELGRRIKILHEEKIDEFLSQNNVSSIPEYIESISSYQKPTKNELIRSR
ncbi:hypothetical protein [Flagellimonas allohymeniacidonis]|uniref:Uncharacterized protein n=1 Tax=Flagellimonas allohymeniacidonis TaxID=2517819 RepID=A0A4V2HSS0_9FLAO|nr:hypothetical protein [Allomuricauda hymeniacidonis]TAI48830.1 hypothetical protein EW142_03255 [Allomuricauda hymeniacidonis]